MSEMSPKHLDENNMNIPLKVSIRYTDLENGIMDYIELVEAENEDEAVEREVATLMVANNYGISILETKCEAL